MVERRDYLDGHGHATLLLAGYSLGVLESDELDAVERHLDGCARCRADAAALRAVAADLSLAAPRVAPPPALKARVQARLASTDTSPIPALSAAPLAVVRGGSMPAPRLRGRAAPLRDWVWPLIASAALLLAAFLGQHMLAVQRQLDGQQRAVVSLQASLQLQMATQARHIAEVQGALARTSAVPASMATIRMLHGTTAAEGALGTLVMSPRTPMGVLVVHHLPSARAGVGYDCWLFTSDGRRTFVGVIEVDRRGDGYMPVHAPRVLGSYAVFGVTTRTPSRASVLQGLMNTSTTTD